VWRTYHGVIFAWDEHWARMHRSAEALFLKLEVTPASILAEIRRTVAAYRGVVPGAGELYIRLQVTRGTGAIGLDVALADRSDYLLLVQPCPVLTPQVAATGVRLAVPAVLRRNPVQSLDPAWKTGNYLNNLLCLREARARGADDALILNLAGEIAEASVSNIAFVRRGTIVTPPLSAGILSGITRALVLDGVAAAAGLPIVEETVRPSDLRAMDESFLLSTTKDIVPVGSIDDVPFPVAPASVTARLKQAFAEMARAYAGRHPELVL